jgi:NADH dehydrogenase
MLPGNIRLSGFVAQLCYLTIHLMYLSGLSTRVRVLLSWLWSFLTWTRGARLIPSMRVEAYMDKAAIAARPPMPAPQEPPPAPH